MLYVPSLAEQAFHLIFITNSFSPPEEVGKSQDHFILDIVIEDGLETASDSLSVRV
jgi:hypothetical protein